MNLIHKKPCGCVIEITHTNTKRGLKTKVKKVKMCPKHKKDKKK